MPKYTSKTAKPTEIKRTGIDMAIFIKSGGRLLGTKKIKLNMAKRKGVNCRIISRKTFIDICLPFSSYEGMKA